MLKPRKAASLISRSSAAFSLIAGAARLALASALTGAILVACGSGAGAASSEPATSSSATAQSQPPERPAACRLALHYVGSTAGTGEVFAYFRVRNQAARICELSKYPSIKLVAPGGRLIKGPKINGIAALVVTNTASALPGHKAGHFYLVFSPLTAGGRRCAPAARQMVAKLSPTASARVALPSRLAKQREPINPCPKAGFSVTRVAGSP